MNEIKSGIPCSGLTSDCRVFGTIPRFPGDLCPHEKQKMQCALSMYLSRVSRYLILATNNWKLHRKCAFHLLFSLPKSSFGEHKIESKCHHNVAQALRTRPRNPLFKDAHAGTKRSLKAKTINRDSGISGTASDMSENSSIFRTTIRCSNIRRIIRHVRRACATLWWYFDAISRESPGNLGIVPKNQGDMQLKRNTTCENAGKNATTSVSNQN